MKPPAQRTPRPLLHDTLSVLLPTPEQTWLLGTCLLTGDRARVAWQTWRDSVGDPRQALARDQQGVGWLLPLLYQSLQSHGIAVDRDLQPYLKTAYFREELRSQVYRRVCHEVLAELARPGIPVIVLGGTALAATVYGDWALRHSGSLDLFVQDGEGSQAEAVLTAAGLSTIGADRTAAQATRFRHKSGLPVVLHRALFPIPYYRAPVADLWEATVPWDIAGVPVRVLAPADMMLHVCGEASCSRTRDTLEWVCDAWHLARRRPDLDWDALVGGTLHSRLELPLFVMLDYLVQDLGVQVPIQALEHLAQASSLTSSLGRQAALTGARAGARGTVRNLLAQTRTWPGRAAVFKWMLLPSPGCLRWSVPARPGWWLPAWYLIRPLRYLARSVRSRLGGGRGP
jgi:hypothetical protein